MVTSLWFHLYGIPMVTSYISLWLHPYGYIPMVTSLWFHPYSFIRMVSSLWLSLWFHPMVSSLWYGFIPMVSWFHPYGFIPMVTSLWLHLYGCSPMACITTSVENDLYTIQADGLWMLLTGRTKAEVTPVKWVWMTVSLFHFHCLDS